MIEAGADDCNVPSHTPGTIFDDDDRENAQATYAVFWSRVVLISLSNEYLDLSSLRSGSSKGSYDTEDINSMHNPALQKSISPQFTMPLREGKPPASAGRLRVPNFTPYAHFSNAIFYYFLHR